MTIVHRGNQQYHGLSSDTKPAAADTTIGAIYEETNTRRKFYNDGTEWIAQEFSAFKKFKVFKEGSKTYVIDIHGKVMGSATETEDAINPILAAQGNNTIYLWDFDTVTFTLFSPILIPSNTVGLLKKNIFRNESFSSVRSGSSGTAGGVTTLIPDATFPTNRYFFECNNPPASGTTSSVEIHGFQAVNVPYRATIRCGFVKLEGDNPNGQNNFVVTNCFLNYMWRGVHLIGYIWYGKFENIFVTISDPLFTVYNPVADTGWGDAPFILEDGGHVDVTKNPTPKCNTFFNIQSHSGDGVYRAFLDMKSGGYNVFNHIFVDGKFYTLAPLYLNNTDTLFIHNNTFNDVMTLDLEVPPATTMQGALYMAGANVYDNVFTNCRFMIMSTKMIKLEGAGVRNNFIQADSYWGGSALTVSHFSSGENNVVEVIAGAKTTAGQLPIVLTGTGSAYVRVIDKRKGAENGGIAATRTDGSTIAHGLFATPAWYFVTGTVAGETVTATADATNLTLAIKKWTGGTLTTGTSQSVAWRAGVYV